MVMKKRFCDKCKSIVPEDQICPCLKTRLKSTNENVSVFIVNKETEVLIFHVDSKIYTSDITMKVIENMFPGIKILFMDKDTKISVVKASELEKEEKA